MFVHSLLTFCLLLSNDIFLEALAKKPTYKEVQNGKSFEVFEKFMEKGEHPKIATIVVNKEGHFKIIAANIPKELSPFWHLRENWKKYNLSDTHQSIFLDNSHYDPKTKTRYDEAIEIEKGTNAHPFALIHQFNSRYHYKTNTDYPKFKKDHPDFTEIYSFEIYQSNPSDQHETSGLSTTQKLGKFTVTPDRNILLELSSFEKELKTKIEEMIKEESLTVGFDQRDGKLEVPAILMSSAKIQKSYKKGDPEYPEALMILLTYQMNLVVRPSPHLTANQ